jgi:hypothetical protein
MESILETKASTILEFFTGLRGTLSVTLEEGTWAAWLYHHVARVVVCNPRKNALLRRESGHLTIWRLFSNKGSISTRQIDLSVKHP